MIDSKQKKLPQLFERLVELGCFSEAEIYATSDGFCAVMATVADILAHRDITALPGSQGDLLDCSLFLMTGISMLYLTEQISHTAYLKCGSRNMT